MERLETLSKRRTLTMHQLLKTYLRTRDANLQIRDGQLMCKVKAQHFMESGI